MFELLSNVYLVELDLVFLFILIENNEIVYSWLMIVVENNY